MSKLSFREYYESKNKLRLAAETLPRVRLEYTLTKYCKIPIFESIIDDTKKYISFKPNDIIEILWEKTSENDDYPIAKRVTIMSEDDQEIFPCWNNKKLHQWIQGNTREL